MCFAASSAEGVAELFKRFKRMMIISGLRAMSRPIVYFYGLHVLVFITQAAMPALCKRDGTVVRKL